MRIYVSLGQSDTSENPRPIAIIIVADWQERMHWTQLAGRVGVKVFPGSRGFSTEASKRSTLSDYSPAPGSTLLASTQ